MSSIVTLFSLKDKYFYEKTCYYKPKGVTIKKLNKYVPGFWCTVIEEEEMVCLF